MMSLWVVMATTLLFYAEICLSQKSNVKSTLKNCQILNSGREINLSIAGFYPFTGNLEYYPTDYWSAIEYVVELALNDIKTYSCILKGYSLTFERKDTECKPAKGMKKLFEVMDSKKTKTPQLALYGGACTTVDEPVAMTTNYFRMVQLSYAENHPKFSIDKEEAYSYFYRMVPSYRNVFIAQANLLKYFNWTKVGIIAQRDDPRYAIPQEEIQSALGKQHGVEVLVSVQFTSRKLNIKENLETLKARRLDLFGSLYVWLLFGYNNDSWWLENPSNCTSEKLLESMDRHFVVEFLPIRNDIRKFEYTGKSLQWYKTELYKTCSNNSSCYNNAYHGFIYDGVWTLALALHQVIVDYKNRRNITFNPAKHIARGDELALQLWSEKLKAYLNNASNFSGLTGNVRFENNERQGVIRIAQFQKNNYKTVGEYAKDKEFFVNESLLSWQGDSIPMASIRHEKENRYIDFAIFCIMSILTALGIAVAFCFLIINIHFRKYKFIRMSSPNMNNMIVAGSMLTYLSVVLLGIDTRLVSQEAYGYLCTAKLWTLSFGFTLAFGSMFSKTWRVHSIFTNIKLNRKVIKDYKLFVLVLILLLLDFVILLVWLIMDRMTWKSFDLPTEIFTDRNLKIDPKIEYCYSEYSKVFQGLLLSFKGILLIAGCFLAWETRHVNVPALNDSKYIGMSVYNVVVMCSLGVPISFILKDNINAAYILISIFVIFCTTLTLVLVFVPKLVQLARNPKDGARKYRQTMMKTVGTAHRAASNDSEEDRHEELSRIETDNTVWRKCLDDRNREILQMLKELAKLGDHVCILPSLESMSISRVSHSSIPEDPFGGVYVGPAKPDGFVNGETISESKSIVVEEVTEKTSLLGSNQIYVHKAEKRSTSLRLSKVRPTLTRSSVDRTMIIENDTLANKDYPYQSVTSLDDICIMTSKKSIATTDNDNLPKDMQFSFMSYIDSIRSEDIMSNSRTLPSIKESCLGTSVGSVDEPGVDLSQNSHSSVSLSIISDEKFFSAVSSLKSSLIFLSVFDENDDDFDDERKNQNETSEIGIPHPGISIYPRSVTQDTWLTSTTDGTLTPVHNSSTTEEPQGISSRDISTDVLLKDKDAQELDVCQLLKQTRCNKAKSYNGDLFLRKKLSKSDSSILTASYKSLENEYETCSSSSSSSSIEEKLDELANPTDSTTTGAENMSNVISDNKRLDSTKRKVHKKRDRFGWLDKITSIKLPLSESATSFENVDSDKQDATDKKPIPTNLLQYKGPECPFIVGTKDFEIYANYIGENFKNKS